MPDGLKLNLNTIPPSPPTEELKETEEQKQETAKAEVPTETQTKQPEQVQETKPDEFIENLNKHFGTTFKADEEVKNMFGLSKKISEYETKLKASEDFAKSNEDLKKRIEELEGEQDPLKYFSSPATYIAEQLRIKYPKSNPVLLQEIATTDVDKMDDFDVLVKDRQLFVTNPPKEEVIRNIIKKKYGIDPTVSPEEWDELIVGEIKLDAAAAREKINNLKGNIEMPKVLNREQRQAIEADELAKREQTLAPLKDTFSKFDKFSHEGFEFDVPSEYQSKLPDMFKAMFVDAGMEASEEGIKSAVELRDALFLLQYFPKIKEVIAKEAETKLQAKIDAELHNTQPPNTTTATDHEDVPTYPSLGDYLSSQRL